MISKILYELGKYSGFLTIILSWLTLVFPFLFLKKRKGIIVISEVIGDTTVGLITKSGVLVCAAAQILFSYFLFVNFGAPVAKLGIVLYGIGSLSFLLCGVVDFYKNRYEHLLFVQGYYILMTIGFILLSFSLPVTSKIFACLLLALPLCFYYLKHDSTKFELSTIILSNLFALSVYRSLGGI